jgi:ribosomal protein S12 methylthiotransferase
MSSAPESIGQKVYFVSLGCPKNRVDSEIMLGDLAARQFEVVQSPDDADVLVVNTCGFVDDAREESVDTILELAQVKTEAERSKKLVVTGCLVQRHADELSREIPEVDLLVGTGEVNKVGQWLTEGRSVSPANTRHVGRPGYNYDAYAPRLRTTDPWTAYVKVAEGCSQRCSFCIIPRLRGGAKSRGIPDVVREVQALAAEGVREVNLIAQDLTHYGDDLKDGTALVGLLKALVNVEGIHWFRLLYCYPHAFTDELIDLIASEPKIASYVDMPLQHISDPMLDIMRRRFDEASTRALINKMRARIPDLVFRTTFIVGHPGETDEDFQRLYDFVEESRFERVGVFKYSKEEGTHASRRDDHVMTMVKESRYHRLMTLQQGISAEIGEAMVGREVDLLVEGVSKETDLLLQARIWGQAPEIDGLTYVGEGWAEPGSIVRGEIVEAGDYDLVARILPTE